VRQNGVEGEALMQDEGKSFWRSCELSWAKLKRVPNELGGKALPGCYASKPAGTKGGPVPLYKQNEFCSSCLRKRVELVRKSKGSLFFGSLLLFLFFSSSFCEKGRERVVGC
jgi:hypothetical protein